ncbi:MAG: hypothetical protein Aurels2KO_44590 [Aureliella sp.]
MLWDDHWDQNEPMLVKLTNEQKLQLVLQSLSYAFEYLVNHANFPDELRQTMESIVSSIAKHQVVAEADQQKLELLIEQYEDDDLNADQPGILDMLLACQFFHSPVKGFDDDAVGDCLSYCYQVAHNIEVVAAMEEGEVLDESELQVLEEQSAVCLEFIRFQFDLLRRLAAE